MLKTIGSRMKNQWFCFFFFWITIGYFVFFCEKTIASIWLFGCKTVGSVWFDKEKPLVIHLKTTGFAVENLMLM